MYQHKTNFEQKMERIRFEWKAAVKKISIVNLFSSLIDGCSLMCDCMCVCVFKTISILNRTGIVIFSGGVDITGQKGLCAIVPGNSLPPFVG